MQTCGEVHEKNTRNRALSYGKRTLGFGLLSRTEVASRCLKVTAFLPLT